MAEQNQPKKFDQTVKKIIVVGAGIVGVPMAALLARAEMRKNEGRRARIILLQRRSKRSGWKVEAINSGKSPIGGIEPGLDKIIAQTVASGVLSASYDYQELQDADVILVCVQTDKKGLGPDYGPLEKALVSMSQVLQSRPAGRPPLIIFESTLAPTSMDTWVREHFKRFDLEEGRDILLGNSPNRVMPGRLVNRIIHSDKIVGGLNPQTPLMIQSLYKHIVTEGTLFLTNSLAAEIVKTLENAYRDVRIAYSAEIARYCDAHDIDFYRVRNAVNEKLDWADRASDLPFEVPKGGLLIPTVGVGGHCLPKDGILLIWRKLESIQGQAFSLFLEARRINEESPAAVLSLLERNFGPVAGKSIALMGVAYRFNSADTRNSPTLELGRLLRDKGCRVILHDPYVRPDDPNLLESGMASFFTQDQDKAENLADYHVFCVAHRDYVEKIQKGRLSARPPFVFDTCNCFSSSKILEKGKYGAGIGKGQFPPSEEFIDFVYKGFRAVETGVANEVFSLIRFANEHFYRDDFNKADFAEVQKLAGTCATGCILVDPGPVAFVPKYKDFFSRLVLRAFQAARRDKGFPIPSDVFLNEKTGGLLTV